MPVEKILKDLMLGLIYPAVLGTILYLALQVLTEQTGRLWTNLFTFQPLSSTDKVLFLKVVLLLVTLCFYLCDFLYILFTNSYRGWFFVADLIFVVGLYVTVVIGIQPQTADNPRTGWILGPYLLFLVLYILWDRSELKRAWGREAAHLRRVIQWECLSVILILIAIGVAYFVPSWHLSLPVTVVALFVVTVWFAVLAWGKREFYRVPQLPFGRVAWRTKMNRAGKDTPHPEVHASGDEGRVDP